MANHIRHGKDKRGRRTAEELGHCETRLKKIREAKRGAGDQSEEKAPQRIANAPMPWPAPQHSEPCALATRPP